MKVGDIVMPKMGSDFQRPYGQALITEPVAGRFDPPDRKTQEFYRKHPRKARKTPGVLKRAQVFRARLARPFPLLGPGEFSGDEVLVSARTHEVVKKAEERLAEAFAK